MATELTIDPVFGLGKKVIGRAKNGINERYLRLTMRRLCVFADVPLGITEIPQDKLHITLDKYRDCFVETQQYALKNYYQLKKIFELNEAKQ